MGDSLLVGEVYLPSAKWQPYLDHLDAAFAFELLHAPWDAEALRRAIEATTSRRGAAWVLSNHDFGRLVTRFGPRTRARPRCSCSPCPARRSSTRGTRSGSPTVPGASACTTAPAATASATRCSGTAPRVAGSRTGEPWLPPVDPANTNVEAQREDPRSTLSLVRDLLALRRVLGDGLELVDAPPGLLAYRRGDHAVAINTTAEALRIPFRGDALLETAPGALRNRTLAGHAGVITRSDEGVGQP